MSKLIHEVIAEYAAGNPSKTAVTDYCSEMSYGELRALSASASRALADFGVKAGDAVAVYVPYSKEIVPGAVAAWQAGGVFLPFDDAYPVERLNYMLEDSEAAGILTVRELWERKPLDYPEERILFMDELEVGEDDEFVCAETLTWDSPAMLLYTSGTTGRPKGVLHRHRLLVNILDWMNALDNVMMDEDTRSGIMSGFTFVATQVFLFGPLIKGGTVCIAPEGARKDLGYLHQFIRVAGITHIFLPSGLGAVMAEDYDITGINVFVAGEKLRNFRRHTPGNTLFNIYGSTEIAVVMSMKVNGDEEHILVGRTSRGTLSMIVDENNSPVAEGEVGELLVSSPFMSLEYYKLPELSAEKWIRLDGEIWYRTGDRARCMPQGDYDILGRTDNMVKLRGFRIETGEVESQIANAVMKLGRGDVGNIVVVLRNVNGTDHLCCYYETKKEFDTKAVSGEAAKYLAEYMVPDVWMRMDAFPRNANGKVMRSELPQPRRERKNITAGSIDSEVLARLVYTAEDVLETAGLVGPDDRFTDLGGDSINAMKYTALLREQGIKISSAQVLQLNSLRKIATAAEVVYEQLWTREEYEKVKADFASRGETIRKVLPISSKQDDLLFEEIIHPDFDGLRDVVLLQVDSRLVENDLREALDTLGEENEELRSAIVFHHVSAIQQVITDRKIPLEMMDVESLGSSEMQELRSRLLNTPMDLQKDSLMKVICVNTAGESFICVMTHCIAFGRIERRRYLARIMEILGEKYPEDTSIQDWKELLDDPAFGERGGAGERGIGGGGDRGSESPGERGYGGGELSAGEHGYGGGEDRGSESPGERGYGGGELRGSESPGERGYGGGELSAGEHGIGKPPAGGHGIGQNAPPEICIYSENDGPKIVFVHTGNTGSSAYYRLAARIGDMFSFSVIEPYNLYHMEEATYGIDNIAANYIRILKNHQPEGPYILGGWCYGGIVAHEMACQLEKAGEDVRLLVLLDAHAASNEQLRGISKAMSVEINREYFETCPLFADLREAGMLEAMVRNAAHVVEDMENHDPFMFHGDVLYFKPGGIPAGVTANSRRYWEKMMEFEAGNYENYCVRERLRIVQTPREHDRMMEDPSLDIIVPELIEAVGKTR